MILYAILIKGTDRSSFWASFQSVYRICKTEDDAKTLLAKMEELCYPKYVVPDDPLSYYCNPVLSDDGKKLSLFYHYAGVGYYTNWDEEYTIVTINNASALFSDEPFL